MYTYYKLQHRTPPEQHWSTLMRFTGDGWDDPEARAEMLTAVRSDRPGEEIRFVKINEEVLDE